jgi:type II secretory pathway pseudopilin PulG
MITSRRTILADQKGAILIGLIVTMIIISIAGSATYYLTTGSSFTELLKSNNLNAYYIAQSGARYAAPLVQSELDSDPEETNFTLDNQTFYLSQGRFTLTVNNTLPNYALLTSVGTLHSGSWFETKRMVVYKLSKSFAAPFNNSADLNRYWNLPEDHTVRIVNTGPSEGSALQFQGSPTSISLNWADAEGNPIAGALNLLSQWQDQGNLLSYNLQVKVNTNTQGAHGQFYMLGISFRLDDSVRHSSYGISFYRKGSGSAPGEWPSTLTSGGFGSLDANTIYLVLWKATSMNTTPIYTLLHYKAMGEPIASSGELNSWSTIGVSVQERYQGDGVTRENLIKGYVVDNYRYPKETINWSFMTPSNLVSGDHWPGEIVNGALTSEAFDTRMPVEIGIHGYYDGNAANDQFFSDFSLGLNSLGSNGSYQQYY